MTDGHYACFRAKNSLGVYGYAKQQIDLTTPTITLSQDQNSVNASAIGIDSSTWAHSTPTDTDQTCASATYNSAGSGENTHTISSSNKDQYICFKVANSKGVYGYKKWQIDFTKPAVTVVQNGTSLTASSAATDLPTSPDWQKSGPHDSSDCDSSTTNFSAGQTVSAAANNKYYCFKVADKAGNVGYGEIQVDLTAPTISISQSNNKLSASGSNLTGWQHFTSSTNPTCDSSAKTNWTTGITDNQTTAAMTDGHYACFRAKNSLGVYGYAKQQIDLTTPTITLSQDQNSVNASAIGIDSSTWAHSTPTDTDQTCASATYNSAGSGENTHTISSSNKDQYICFKVANSKGVYGYKKWQIDFTKPAVTVVQNGTSLTASSAATDLPTSPDWQKSGPHDSSDCDSSTTNFSAGQTVSAAADNKYYCFKVADKAGNVGYGEIQVDLTAPTISISQSNNKL